MAPADKISLKNKHLRNGDYFAITAFCSHSILLTNYATGAMDLLLYEGSLVVTTINLKISRWRLADYVKKFHLSACRTCSTVIFAHSTNQIIVFWRCHFRCCRLCFSSLIGSFSNEDCKRHLKINICGVVTILWLSDYLWILRCLKNATTGPQR